MRPKADWLPGGGGGGLLRGEALPLLMSARSAACQNHKHTSLSCIWITCCLPIPSIYSDELQCLGNMLMYVTCLCFATSRTVPIYTMYTAGVCTQDCRPGPLKQFMQLLLRSNYLPQHPLLCLACTGLARNQEEKHTHCCMQHPDDPSGHSTWAAPRLQTVQIQQVA